MLHEAKSLGMITHKYTQLSDPGHSQRRQKKNTETQKKEKMAARGRSQNTREHLIQTFNLQMGKVRSGDVKCLAKRHTVMAVSIRIQLLHAVF